MTKYNRHMLWGFLRIRFVNCKLKFNRWKFRFNTWIKIINRFLNLLRIRWKVSKRSFNIDWRINRKNIIIKSKRLKVRDPSKSLNLNKIMNVLFVNLTVILKSKMFKLENFKQNWNSFRMILKKRKLVWLQKYNNMKWI